MYAISKGGTMNTEIASAKAPSSNPDFSRVKTGRCTAYGVLSDKKGNTFDIEIKGTDEKMVRRFIRYELKQAKQGKGIKARVEPYGKLPPALPGEAPKRVHRQTKWNGISVKIKEKRVKAKKPYKLHLEIDPFLSAGESQDYTFDNQTAADVMINVTEGSATVMLFEFIDTLKTICTPTVLRTGNPMVDAKNPRSLTLSAGQQLILTSPSRYTQDWNCRVIAGQNRTYFTLALDLFVT
jgi:hypothetical protein